jgi:hypothetical protein
LLGQLQPFGFHVLTSDVAKKDRGRAGRASVSNRNELTVSRWNPQHKIREQKIGR